MKLKLALASIIALTLISCAITPEAVRVGTTLGVSNYIQALSPSKQVATAKEFHLVSTLPITKIPTPEDFKVELDKILPDNQSKQVTVENMVVLYELYYPRFKDKAPQLQLDYLSALLMGADLGSRPFLY